MSEKRFSLFLLVICLLPVTLTGLVFADEPPGSEFADIVLMNGTVYTVEYGTNWPDTPHEAIAIHGRSILAVDTNSGIKQYIGPDTQVHDLMGKMVLPGFIDTHIHLGAAAQIMAGVDLLSCTSLSEIQSNLSDYAEKNKDVPVIRGFGWNYFLFNESGPHKEMLEKILPKASEAGITTADDAAVSPEIISAFADLEDEGKLPVRVFGEIVALPELGVEEIPLMEAERSIFYPGYPTIEEGYSYIDDLPGLLDGESSYNITLSTLPDYSDDEGLFRIQTGKLFLGGC